MINSKSTFTSLAFTLRYVFLFVITVLFIGPLIWVFLSAFKTNREILDTALSWPSRFSLVSYREVFEIMPLYLFLFNSFVISLTTTVLALVIFGMAGYVFARFEFRGKNLLYLLLSSSILIPLNALLHPIYIVVRSLNLYDTKAGVILVFIALGLPISLFLLRSFFASIPKEMEEAAYIEGAGFFHTYIRIMLPLSIPAQASAGVLLFLVAWNNFLFPLILTSSKANRVVALALRFFVMAFTYDYSALFAAIAMTITPSIVIYVIFQEQLTKSLGAGALKG